jgi:retinoid hydroxylase
VSESPKYKEKRMTKQIADLPQLRITKNDIMSGRLAARQAEMALKYGPIFMCVLEDDPEIGKYVCLVGAEASRFVFHTGREYFSHDRGWTPLMGVPLGQGLLNMDAPEHTRHRKMWNPAFTGPSIEAYMPVIARVIAARTSSWPQQPEVDIYREMQQITFTAAGWALAGFQPGPQLEELGQLFYQHTVRDRRDQILLDLIAERRARPLDEQPRDVLGQIVSARDGDGQPLSDEQILAHINILLAAGHETTTSLGSWVLYLLATMPEQRRRIAAEIADVLGDTASGLIAVEALRELKQLDNFIKEAGRLYAPVITVPRGVLREVEFGGYTLPAGTPVRLALAAAHLLPHVFADPQRFDPDRFAPPREEDRHTPYGLVTFGGGSRICIGINFANIETKALAVHVLRHYRLAVVEGQRIVNAGHITGFLERGVRMRVYPK